MKKFDLLVYKDGNLTGFSTCAETIYIAKARAREFGKVVMSYKDFEKANLHIDCTGDMKEAYLNYLEK